MRSRSARRWSIAGAPSGSLSKTTARRAAPPSRATSHLRRGRGRLLARADDRGDAGLAARRASCRRASCAARAGDCRARARSTSVGETIPGAKPRLGRVVGAAHLVAGRQRAHEAQPERRSSAR